MMLRFHIPTIWFCFLISSLPAQPDPDHIVHIRHLSAEDGLASREVLCGVQDRDGFVWLGTRSGLNRFDGKQFIVYNRPNSRMRQNKVVQLAVGDSFSIWLMYGHRDGPVHDTQIDILDSRNGAVTSFPEKFGKAPFTEKDVVWLAGDPAGKIQFYLKDGRVFTYPGGSGFFAETRIWKVSPRSVNQLRSGIKEWPVCDYLEIGNDSALLFPLTSGKNATSVLTYREASEKFEWGDLQNDCAGLLPPSFWVEKSVRLGGVSINSVELYYDAVSGNSIIHHDNHGVYYFDGKAVFTLIDEKKMKSFPSFTPTCYFTDSQGQHWICTNTGVLIIRERLNRFVNYFTKEQITIEHFDGNQARGIFADTTGNVFANVWDRLFLLRDGGDFKQVKNVQVSYALLGSDSFLFIGGFNIFQFERNGRLLRKSGTVDGTLVWSLLALSDSVLLGGTESGFFRYHIRKDEITPVSVGSFPKPRTVYRILRSHTGELWAASQNGLYRMDGWGNITQYLGASSTDPSTAYPFKDLYDVYEDRIGRLWMTTDGNGIYCWDGKKDVMQYTIANGLPSNLLYCIQEDESGRLWISSDNGLTRFDPVTRKAKTYTTADGVAHNEFNRISSFRAADGQLFFGGLNGVTAFYPDDFTDDTTIFQAPVRLVSFHEFSSHNDSLEDKMTEYKMKGSIRLDYTTRFFTVEFMLLDFEKAPHRYAYRLEGIDKAWIYTHENNIRFSRMPYGEFILRIKGQNSRGEWSSRELVIPVRVLKPFYLQLWFILFTGGAFLLSLVLFIRWRTKWLRKEKERLELLVDRRTEELKQSLEQKEVLLKEVHHRVKNNLAIISSLLELQQANVLDEKAREVLRESQNRVQSIALIHHRLYQTDDLSVIELGEFMQALYKQVHSLFGMKSDIKAEFDIPETLIDIDTAVPAGLIANELFINAFKYAFADRQQGRIIVKLEKREVGYMHFIVQDDGHGMPAGFDFRSTKTLGLRLVSGLARQLGGDATYAYEKGSRFVIRIKGPATQKKAK